MHHDPNHPDLQSLFTHGLSLFNQGEYFEAHEVWEDLWHAESGPDKLFIQALIQFAVALVHHQRSNPRGVRSVTQSALKRLHDASSSYRGLTKPAVLAELTRVTAPTLALPESTFTPGLQHPPNSLPTAPGLPPRL